MARKARRCSETFIFALLLLMVGLIPSSLLVELVAQTTHTSAPPPSCPKDWAMWNDGMSCYRKYTLHHQIADDTPLDVHAYAVKACQNASTNQEFDAHLVTITSDSENSFIASSKDLVIAFSFRLIGLRRSVTGEWLWATGEAMNYENWSGTDNSNVNPLFRCAYLRLNGEWERGNCYSKYAIYYICEFSLSGDMNNSLTGSATPSEPTLILNQSTVSERLLTDSYDDASTEVYSLVTIVSDNDRSSTTFVLSVVLPASVGLPVLLVIITSVYKCRRRQEMAHRKQNALNRAKPELSDILIAMLDNDKKWKLQNLLVHRDRLEVHEERGQGAFGIVYKGCYSPHNNLILKQTVAVKTLKDRCIGAHIAGLVAEAITMAEFSHAHIMPIIGVCIRPDDGIPMLLLPYMDNGDLKTYLRKFSFEKRDVEPPDEKQLILFTLHIVRGMEYLAEQKFVHRDLAARNCMLDGKLVVKVGDFGLTRDVYTSSYYRQENQKLLPIKWMAPESLEFLVFTIETDIWSFGVTMWEVFAMGRVPYPDLENQDVRKNVASGTRLQKSTSCPDQIYCVMSSCWNTIPEDRPSFDELSKTIANYLADMCCYVNMDQESSFYEEPNHADGTDDVHVCAKVHT